MTVRVGPGTQATDSSLIEEEASRLPHCTIQRSFPFAALVYLLWTCNTSIRYRALEADHLPLSCSLLFLEVLLKRTPHLRSGAVEEDPLIPLGNAEGGADFIRCPSLYVAQDD